MDSEIGFVEALRAGTTLEYGGWELWELNDGLWACFGDEHAILVSRDIGDSDRHRVEFVAQHRLHGVAAESATSYALQHPGTVLQLIPPSQRRQNSRW
jgi:hypothetical protein